MPAPKPLELHNRHNTKAEKQARLDAEAALHPEKGMPSTTPATIKDDKIAAKTWRRMLKEYGHLKAELVSRLDIDLLLDYCIVTSQIVELESMRSNSFKVWKYLNDQRVQLAKDDDHLGALALIDKIQKAYDVIIKIDARLDAKRKLIFSYRQSLYLTPRSRAGVKPAEDTEKDAPVDPLEAALNARYEAVKQKVGDLGDHA